MSLLDVSRFQTALQGDKIIHLPFKSVDTPVAYNPRDATAKEPPRSTLAVRDDLRYWGGKPFCTYPC